MQLFPGKNFSIVHLDRPRSELLQKRELNLPISFRIKFNSFRAWTCSNEYGKVAFFALHILIASWRVNTGMYFSSDFLVKIHSLKTHHWKCPRFLLFYILIWWFPYAVRYSIHLCNFHLVINLTKVISKFIFRYWLTFICLMKISKFFLAVKHFAVFHRRSIWNV